MSEWIILISDNQKIGVEYLYCVEDYHTMKFKVKSSGFAGQSSFCISKTSIQDIIRSLECINNELKGVVEINDGDSDSHIRIELKKFGRLDVSGQIGGSFEDHYLKFKLESDQTILKELMNFFQTILG